MRFQPVLAAAAFLALVAATPSGALPPRDFCENNPESPICNPEEPPDPCDLNPELCEPPDPCVANPELCEPPDPCVADPASCEPVDPCVADPASCENDPEPEPTALFSDLTGSGRVKGRGFKATAPVEFGLAIDGATFTIVNGACDVYQGQLAPKGKNGQKFQLFLDPASRDAYTQFVSQHASAARGLGMGAPLGESSRIVMKRSDDGSVSLKLKSEVLFEDGDVVFKAHLTGVLSEERAARPSGARCL